jgi:hypothetical protein
MGSCGVIKDWNKCESVELSEKRKCVWGRDSFGNGMCVPKDSLKCDDYLSSIGCLWGVTDKSELMICRWDEQTNQCYNSEGCEFIREEGKICEEYVSKKGGCFFNGEGVITTAGKTCSNIIDIKSCSEFLFPTLCILADKSLYTQLFGNSRNPCIWDVEKQECISKKEGENSPEGENSSSTIIIIIVVLVVVVAVVGILVIVIIILIYRRKSNKDVKNIMDDGDRKTSEMELLKMNVDSSSTKERMQKKTSFFFCYNRFIYLF